MELQKFENDLFSLIVKSENGENLFDAETVARNLGITSRSKKNGVEYESVRWTRVNDFLPKVAEIKKGDFISEPMVYKLAIKANNPLAEKFQDWLAVDVLPTIRKHGAYLTDEKIEEALLSPDTIIKMAQQIKDERAEKDRLRAVNSSLTVANQIMEPKARYFDDLVERNLLTNFRDTAKALKVKEKVFINFLIDKKYIYRDKKGKLVPRAEYNGSLFELKETMNQSNGWKGVQTLITPRGRETFNLLSIDIRNSKERV